MKKRLVCGLMAVMMVMSLTACSKSGNTNNTDGANDTVTATDYKEYMTLGDYKNIAVNADPSSLEVTQEEIQSEIDACLAAYAETKQVTTGTVKDGDTINMDFSGLLNGVAFSNGTATDYSYTVGGNFIEDLDRGLVGLEIGKEYEIPCTFPQNYGTEELNGKDVIFVVTVNYVEEYILPEYNDEFVKMMTTETAQTEEDILNTTAELEESIKEYLAEYKQEQYNTNVYGQMMISILDSAEIKGVPEAELNDTIAMIKENAEYEFSLYGPYYGIDNFETYLTSVCGYASMEAFETEVNEYATEYMYERMAICLIAENEGITVTQEEKDAFANDLLTQTEYKTVEELKEAYGETYDADVEYQLLYDKTMAAIIEMAKVK